MRQRDDSLAPGQRRALRTALLQLQIEAGLQDATDRAERRAAVAEALRDWRRAERDP